MTADRPRVTLKLATSLDGRIALANGQSRWITGKQARAEVHKMRASHDVVLTGIGTVLADNPEMTARPGERLADIQPRRAVMDSRARLPANSMMLKAGRVTVFHVCDAPPASLSMAGVQLVQVDADAQGRASLMHALTWLQASGAQSVMVEAGGALASSAIKAGVVDRIEWFRAPVLLGGDSQPCIAGLGLETLDAPPTFCCVESRACGRDSWESWDRV